MGNNKSSFTEGNLSPEEISKALVDFAQKEASELAKGLPFSPRNNMDHTFSPRGHRDNIFSPKDHGSKEFNGYFSDEENSTTVESSLCLDPQALGILNGNPFGSPKYTSPCDSSFVLSLSPRSEGDEFDVSSFFPPTPTSPKNQSPVDLCSQKDVVTPDLTAESESLYATPRLESLHMSPKGSRRSRRGGLFASSFSQVPESIRSIRSDESRDFGGGSFEDLPHPESLSRRRIRQTPVTRAVSKYVAAQGNQGPSEYNNVLYSYGSVRTSERSSSYFESISSEVLSPLPRRDQQHRRASERIRGESLIVRRRLPEYGGCQLPVE